MSPLRRNVFVGSRHFGRALVEQEREPARGHGRDGERAPRGVVVTADPGRDGVAVRDVEGGELGEADGAGAVRVSSARVAMARVRGRPADHARKDRRRRTGCDEQREQEQHGAQRGDAATKRSRCPPGRHVEDDNKGLGDRRVEGASASCAIGNPRLDRTLLGGRKEARRRHPPKLVRRRDAEGERAAGRIAGLDHAPIEQQRVRLIGILVDEAALVSLGSVAASARDATRGLEGPFEDLRERRLVRGRARWLERRALGGRPFVRATRRRRGCARERDQAERSNRRPGERPQRK